MRIVIAGGSGLIGRVLTKLLIADNCEVFVLSRHPEAIQGFPKEAQLIQWDGKTIQKWSDTIDKTDAIVNLTGENLSGEKFFPSRWSSERKERLTNSRISSGNALVQYTEWLKEKPSVFVQASGISYYGTDPSKDFTEESEGVSDFLGNLSKEWEESTKKVESMGVRRVIIRNGVVLSTRGGALPRILLPYKLFVGGPLGNGKQYFSWIHIDDEARAIKFLIENDSAVGVFNLVSHNPITNRELGRTIARIMKRPYFLPIPGLLMYLAFGEVASVVLEGQKVFPKKLLENGFIFTYPELEGALRDLLQNPGK